MGTPAAGSMQAERDSAIFERRLGQYTEIDDGDRFSAALRRLQGLLKHDTAALGICGGSMTPKGGLKLLLFFFRGRIRPVGNSALDLGGRCARVVGSHVGGVSDDVDLE